MLVFKYLLRPVKPPISSGADVNPSPEIRRTVNGKREIHGEKGDVRSLTNGQCCPCCERYQTKNIDRAQKQDGARVLWVEQSFLSFFLFRVTHILASLSQQGKMAKDR